jgi:hypothetical protein
MTIAAASGPATTNDCNLNHPELAAAEQLAAAIAAGKDLGVFELCGAVAKAREAIPLGSSPQARAAVHAAIGIRAAFEKAASAFAEIQAANRVCPCCKLCDQLDELIEIAARPGDWEPLAATVEELAEYAGDDYPDADCTRRVLELARDVFVAAIADRLRDE